MSTTHSAVKWSYLVSCPSNEVRIPTGRDGNNYIVMDRIINCVYKYNIENDIWIKIDFNNPEKMTTFSTAFSTALDVKKQTAFSTALDVKKQILFLFTKHSIIQMTLDYNYISNDNHKKDYSAHSIVINDSLFSISHGSNSILKWNSENKTLTEYSVMYNKIKLDDYAIIYNNKNHSLLLFGGWDWNIRDYVDHILEFNVKTKQWNKLPVALPREMGSLCCTMAFNNKYVLLFGGENNDEYYDDIYIYSLKHKTL
eukprot:353396_1